jgi:hypothetical protein
MPHLVRCNTGKIDADKRYRIIKMPALWSLFSTYRLERDEVLLQAEPYGSA